MKKAYSITELLVVVLIVALLTAILLPVLVQSKRAAGKTVCASNMHQIYLAAKLYQDDNGSYPNGILGDEFKPYYPTVLTCPASKNIQRPNLRVVDYTFVGSMGLRTGATVQEAMAAFESCKATRGPALPVVLDENHIAFDIQAGDNTSRFLLVREDGSYDTALAIKQTSLEGVCSAIYLPYWYNL